MAGEARFGKVSFGEAWCLSIKQYKAKETTMEEKAKESKLRRILQKQGYYLKKSRIRNINADDLGGYMILDAYYGAIVRGSRYSLDLDDVEQFASE